MFLIFILARQIFSSEAWACDPGLLKFPITDKSKTHIRKGNGEWHAPRGDDGLHGGVDLIVDASYPDNASYAVYPILPGTVVYSNLNGTATSGYGNAIIVDHGNNCYSLYAHLANSPFTPIVPGGNLLKKVGDSVASQNALGYFVDIRAEVDSTGNARSTAPEARHQVHFELLSAPSGRKGLVKDILKNDGKRVDPTPVLVGLGYAIR
jgi:murein DD-endopeptidase MepM/ murein hydrolase activator NlpD